MSEYNEWKMPNTLERLLGCLSKPYTKVNYFNEPLQGEELKPFIHALSTNTTLTVLSLQYNELGDEGAKLLFRALEGNSTVLSIGVRDNGIKDGGAEAVASCLRVNTSLTALSLRDNLMGKDGVAAISKAMESNDSLLSLDLNGNAALDLGVEALARALEKNVSLTRVDLDRVGCGDQGVQALANALSVNVRLRSLSLEDNEVGARGLRALSSALEVNETLCTLNLYANHGIGDAGVEALISALGQNRSITQINVGGINGMSQEVKLGLHRALDTNANLQKKAFSRALNSNETSAWGRSKLLVVGRGGVGKTASVRSLLGESFEPEWISTVGLDIREAKTRVGMKWKMEDAKEYTAAWVNKTAALKLSKSPRKESEDEHAEPQSQHPPQPRNVEDVVSVLPSYALSFHARTGALRFNRASFLEVLNDSESIQLQILDYGGQEVFHGLHHMLMSKYGIYLLVVDFRDVLTGGRGEGADGSMKFWLNMIELYAPEAPVVVACTFWDENKSRWEVENVVTHVKREAGSDVMFFPVDNKSQNGIAALRNKIESLARKQDFVKKPVSIKWMMCLDTLLESDKPWRSLQEVMEIATDLEIARGEVTPMLRLFHEFGTVFYFASTQALKEIVTTNPQWLIDTIAAVVRDKVIHAFDEASIDRVGLRSDFDAFVTEAIASRDLLEFLWQRSEVDFLLDFMKSILLLSRWSFDSKEERYLVPSMIGNDPRRAPLETPHARIDFPYLPNGVFERLACLCVEYSSALPGSKRASFQRDLCVSWLGEQTQLIIHRVDHSIVVYTNPITMAEWCLRVLTAFLRKIKQAVTGDRLKYRFERTSAALQVVEDEEKPAEVTFGLDQFLGSL